MVKYNFIKNNIIFFLLVFLGFSCNKKDSDIIKYKGNDYIKDEYIVFNSLDKKNNLKNNYNYIREKNDSIFLLENYNCNIWLLGVLKDNQKTLSLNNGCGNSTIISHIISRTEMYKITNKKLFLLRLSLGYNSLNGSDVKRVLVYSKDEGIISIYKNDTLLFNNLDW